jgi:hypothetical protein
MQGSMHIMFCPYTPPASCCPCSHAALQGGSLILRDSDITSSSGAGVAVEGGNLQMLRCAVHDCQQHGVAIFGDLEGRPGRVLLEQCSISSNKADGVLVRQGARPILKECTIILNKGYGMQLQVSPPWLMVLAAGAEHSRHCQYVYCSC